MKTKEFIEGIANGTFSKNDIIMLSEAFPDKKDLAWDLWMADKECLESTGKPQISDEAQISRISRAIDIISNEYQINIFSDEKPVPGANDQEIHSVNFPEDIANSPLAQEMLNKCKDAGLLDLNYQPTPGTTKWQQKEIADHISSFCNFRNKWRPFEILWNTTGVDKYKKGKGVRQDYIKRQEIIDRLFEPYVETNKRHIRLE